MKKSTIFLAAAVAVATAGTAYGQGRLEKIKSTGQITIGYRNASIPFSYLDGQQKPVGYSMDICRRVVDAVGRQLDMGKNTINLVPVTSSTRITLVANGTVDLVCRSSPNPVARQAHVSFAPNTFITAPPFAPKNTAPSSNRHERKRK